MCNLFSEYVSQLVLPLHRMLIIFPFPLVPGPTSLFHGSANGVKEDSDTGGEAQETI